MKKNIFKFVFVFIALVYVNGKTQELIRTNPADIIDSKTLFINPAVLPMQNMAFNLGMKVYQYGFDPRGAASMKHSYSSNSYPGFLFENLGIGFTVQNFNTSLFNTTGIGFSVGYLITEGLSLGVSAKANNISYNLDNVNKEYFDISDIVFANGTGKWNGSFDAGFLVRPNENLSVGFSVNNFNRPDISLNNDGARVPIEYNFGGKYGIKKFAFSVFGNYKDDHLTMGLTGEFNLLNRALLKAGYCEKSLLFEGQFALYKGLNLLYRVEYPFFYEIGAYSSGSHQVGVSWNLRYNPMYAFSVKASVDTVRIVKEKTVIRIRDDVNKDSVFAQFDIYDFEFDDNKNLKNNFMSDEAGGLPMGDFDTDALPTNTKLETFHDNFEDIKNYIDSTGSRIDIDLTFTDALTAERAQILKEYLIDSLGFKNKEIGIRQELNSQVDDSLSMAKKDSLKFLFDVAAQMKFDDSRYIEISSPEVETMVPDNIVFNISNIRTRNVSKWRILITDFLGKKIHEITGAHNVEDFVHWDGFTNEGKLLDIGNYYYNFQYTKGDNRWIPKRPKRHRIVFLKVRRENEIDIRKDTVDNFNLLRGIVIRLKNPLEAGAELNQ